MGAPKGSQYALGNKGGGRHPMAIESKAYEILAKAVTEGIDYLTIEKQLKEAFQGKRKLKFLDLYLKKAAKNDRILQEIINKIIPTKQEVTQSGEVLVQIVNYNNNTNTDIVDKPIKIKNEVINVD